jgi:quercetin dioxygenase-like cupin family protein
MEIKRNGSQPSVKGPAEYFTGQVRIDPLFQAPEPARATGGLVTFEPGARSAWHTQHKKAVFLRRGKPGPENI